MGLLEVGMIRAMIRARAIIRGMIIRIVRAMIVRIRGIRKVMIKNN